MFLTTPTEFLVLTLHCDFYARNAYRLLKVQKGAESETLQKECVPHKSRPQYTDAEDKALVTILTTLCLTENYKEKALFAEVQYLLSQNLKFPRREKNSVYDCYPQLSGYVCGYKATELTSLGLALLLYYNDAEVPRILRQKLRDDLSIVVSDRITDEDYRSIQEAVREGHLLSRGPRRARKVEEGAADAVAMGA